MGFLGNIGAFRHGGFCCGVTHMYGFEGPPDRELPAQLPTTVKQRKEYSATINCYWGFFHCHYPAQTALERFHATINHIINGEASETIDGVMSPSASPGRRDGCIEIVLTSYQQQSWDAIVRAAGFVMVKEFRNSNTGKMLKMYLLETKDYVKPKPEPKPTPDPKTAVKKAVNKAVSPFL